MNKTYTVINGGSKYKAFDSKESRLGVGLREVKESIDTLNEMIGTLCGGGGKSQITDMAYFCNYGRRLDEIHKIDTSVTTDFSSMFSQASEMIAAPEVDTSNGTNFYRMFAQCTKLTTVPVLNTGKGTNFKSMFSNCELLTCVSGLDLNSATEPDALKDIFNACWNLRSFKLYNLRVSLDLTTSWYGDIRIPYPDKESLIHTIKEMCKVETQQTFTIGEYNLGLITSEYCRVIDNTTEKVEMELCGSQNDGAMPLLEYVALKNWAIV